MPDKLQPSERLRILVAGLLVRRPIGGLAWHYLHYLLGLHALGHEVFYLECSDEYYPTFYEPDAAEKDTATSQSTAFQRQSYNSSYGLEFTADTLHRLGLGERWGFWDGCQGRMFGPLANVDPAVYRSADILLNISNWMTLDDWLCDIPIRVLVDTDPVFSQAGHLAVPQSLDLALRHNAFLTFGENYGVAACGIPEDGFPWRPTRQPIVLDQWPQTRGMPDGSFTTVMSWDSYDPAIVEKKRYGLKSDSFQPYFDLPEQTGETLELAMNDGSGEVRSLLGKFGWRLRDAVQTTRDPWTYRQYIEASKAEFAIAKHAYAATNSGWFSERSACYLAAGRPVITQETGFSRWMDVGRGVFSFEDPVQALAAINEVSGNYGRHCDYAREVAAEYFDHRKVLPEMLDSAINSANGQQQVAPVGAEMLTDFHNQVERIAEQIPADETFLLVDDAQWGVIGHVGGRRFLPFLERNGGYYGKPADDSTAISELDRMIQAGARYIVFAAPSAWWLDFYVGFRDHLVNRHRLILRDEKLAIFKLNA